MLSEAKDTCELMVDLGYAALFFADEPWPTKCSSSRSGSRTRARDARSVCARGPLHATPNRCRACCTSCRPSNAWGTPRSTSPRIVTHQLGIPPRSSPTSPPRDEISHGSGYAPTPVGGPLARRRRASGGDRDARRRDPARPRMDHRPRRRRGGAPRRRADPAGASEGIGELRELAGAPEWRPAALEEHPAITDLDRAVDVLVEMKNVSEAAVGLAYSALLFKDQGLAAAGRASSRTGSTRCASSSSSGCCAPRPRRSTRRGSRPAAPRRRSRRDRRRRPADGVAGRGGRGDAPGARARARRDRRRGRAVPDRAPARALDGTTLARQRSSATTPASTCSRIRRGGRYVYRPRGHAHSQAGDEILATGPWEGRDDLAEQCGFRLIEDDDTGTFELEPLTT